MRDPVIPQFDAETYLLWESRQPERFELHHGFAVAFAGGTIDHSQIALNLQVALGDIYPNPCRTFGSDVKVQASENSFFYPDAGVVCTQVTGDEASIRTPAVLCEVLSPSTSGYDRVEKRAAYRGIPSLEAYIVVHTLHQRIEIDLRNTDGTWRTTILDVGSAPLGTGSLSIGQIYNRTSVPSQDPDDSTTA